MESLKNFFTKERLILIINIFFLISIIMDLHIFYNSISTLIRVVFISCIFLIIFLFYANKKEKKYLISYFMALSIYIILHLINCNFFSLNINYNLLNELLYFLKMIMNIFIVFIIYKLDYKLNNFKIIVQVSTLVIAGSIIVCNIFKIGYTSYDFNKISVNIFEWFNGKDLSFYEMSTKGFFHLTNQIAAILSLNFSLLLIYLKEKFEWKSVISLLFCAIAMIMLGTRISSYMPLILLVLALISYILLVIIKREKLIVKFIICLIILFSASYTLVQYAPIVIRNEYYDILFSKPKDLTSYEKNILATPLSELSNKEFRKYLLLYNIDEDFYNTYYKLELDREFYEKYVSLETTKKNDTRFLEEEVIKRITYLNNNKFDNYFGIGYDRIMNVFNIEKDYVVHYYSIGLIGTILVLGLNVIILIWSYLKILFNLHKYFNYKNIMLIATLTMFLAIAYLGGNLLNSISCILPISIVVGILINEIKKESKKNKYEMVLNMKTCTLNKKEILKELFLSNNQNIIFNVNPIIAMNMRKDVENLKVINKELYNIPDGNGVVIASKLKSGDINESIPGIDLMNDICSESCRKNYSIYLYGAKEESVLGTKDALEKKYKDINISGYSNGYIDEKKALKDILKNKPDILFVALGSPKQEEFLIDNKEKLSNIKIIMPVGGSFDVISGRLKRAPKWIIKIKMEWLYRMIKEPKRFRQLKKLFGFIILSIFSNTSYVEATSIESD